MFAVILCLRLAVKPFDALVELKNELEEAPSSCTSTLRPRRSINDECENQTLAPGGFKRASCRRCTRGSTLAQSFSLGTVSRPRLTSNRRSAR